MRLRFNYTCFYTHIYFPSTGRVTSDTEGRVLTEYITGGSYIIVSGCSLVCMSYRNSGMVACYSQGRVLLFPHALSIMRSLSPVCFIISTPVVLAQPTRTHSRQTRTRPTHTLRGCLMHTSSASTGSPRRSLRSPAGPSPDRQEHPTY